MVAVVTLYATLGEDAIAHGINETEVTIVVTTHELLPKIKNILHKTPLVKTVIYMEDQLHATDTKCKEDVTIIPFRTVLTRGQASKIGEFLLQLTLTIFEQPPFCNSKALEVWFAAFFSV